MEMGSLPQRSVAKPPSFLSVEIIEEQPRPSSELTQEVSPTIIQSPTSAFLEAPRVKRNKSTRSSKSLPTSTLCSSPNDDSDLGEDSFVTFDVPNRGVKEKLKHWQSGDPFYEQTELLKETENDAWEIAYALAREHDKGMCSAWREEIDKLMIFAGLFAATVVAFLVVSYQMLQPNPSVVQNQIYVSLYTTWVALYQAHLNGTTMVDIQFPSPPSSSVFQPSGSVLRMNAVWFLSLTLSLGTVLIGTICLQWIREYERDTRRGPKEGFAVRQMRYDGMNYWGVPLIISSLPILLQSSLLLFFWGMLEFLWNLNTAVTLINCIVIGVIFFFMLATITLPALQCVFISNDKLRGSQCPFKSPQARFFAFVAFWLALPVVKFLRVLKGDTFLKRKRAFLERLLCGKGSDWVPFDNAWQKLRLVQLPGTMELESCDIPRGLAWLARTYVHKTESLQALNHFVRNIHPSTSLLTLKKLKRMGKSTLISKFEPQWNHPHRRDDILADIFSAFLLDHQVKCNLQRQSPLLHRRVELFIRIANYGLKICGTKEEQFIGSFVEECLSMEPHCVINPFHEEHDYTTLPDDFKHQLLLTFKGYLKADLFNSVLWSIIKPMAFQVVMSHASTFEPDSPLLQELSTLNSDFMEYFHRSGMLSKLELTPAFDFLHYVFQFMANEEAYHRMRACFPEFFAGLHSLKTLLERHITACSSSVNFLDNVSQIMGSKDIYHKTPQFDEFFAGLYFSTAGTPGCTRARGRSLSIGRF